MKKFLILMLVFALLMGLASSALAVGIFGGDDEEDETPLGDPVDVLSYEPGPPIEEEIPLSAPTSDGLSVALVALVALVSLGAAVLCIRKARA